MISLSRCVRKGSGGLSAVPNLAKRCLKEDLWQRRLVGQTNEVIEFDRFEDFVVTPPLEGLGATVQLLKNLCRDDVEALSLIDEAVKQGDGAPKGNRNAAKGATADREMDQSGETTVNNVNGCSGERPVGNSRDAALRRLRKDRPDLLDRVQRGELSANAAMIEAGFRKPPPTPLEAMKRAWERATRDERQAFAEWLTNVVADTGVEGLIEALKKVLNP